MTDLTLALLGVLVVLLVALAGLCLSLSRKSLELAASYRLVATMLAELDAAERLLFVDDDRDGALSHVAAAHNVARIHARDYGFGAGV